MNLNCSNQDPCPVILDSKCVIYEGENLLYIGVNTNDNFRFALEQINTVIGNLILAGGITQLTGDVIAYGPGMAVAQLATVNSNVGQFGSSTAIPKITVNAKGLVTAISTDPVFIPSGALNFIGDVTGSGNTGSDTTLTLKTVNGNVYTTDNFLKFAVNAKGLITSATPVTSSDIITTLGYTPYNSTNPAAYISGIDSSMVVAALGYTPQPAGNYITDLTGEATATGPGITNITLNNAAVIGKVLSGLNVTGGSISAADTIVKAFGKLQNQINGLIGGSIYQGTWNAATNTPTLTSGVGTKGWYYIVDTPGTTNLDGYDDWGLGDWAIFDGTAWQQVDNTDAVVSVNGEVGAVNLTTDNISEGLTNQYFLNSRARLALSGGTGISYDNITGVITNTITQYTDALARQAISLTTTGSSGAATYDNITGVLNIPNYTSALTGYIPYTGATANVDLGTYGLLADYLQLNILPTAVPTTVSTMSWNDDYGTMDIRLKRGNVRLQVGQENVVPIINKTGTNLLESNYQIVRIRSAAEGGAQGQRLAVKLALADSDTDSATTLGIVTENINDNQEGFITVFGNVSEINTTGSLQGEAWVDGDTLYLSPTVPGALTKIKPVAPQHMVTVGYVVYAHSQHGIIFTKIDNGYELEELHNVYAPDASKVNNDVLTWDAATSLWVNRSIIDNLGYTPIGGTGTIDYLPMFTASGTIGNSNIRQDGAGNVLINIPTGSSDYSLEVGGDGYFNGGGIFTGSIQANQYATLSTDVGYSTIIGNGIVTSNKLQVYGSVGITGIATFGSTLSNGTYTYTLPGATGTLALTSQIPSLAGYVPTTRTLTINGTPYDLSADRSWTIGTTILNGTGFVKANGTTITYDNSTYYLASNPSGYITGITSANVTTALGYTPYNATNPAGYITSSGNITGYAMSLNGYAQQTEYTILTGSGNGPVIKVRYDGGTANRYIDIGSKDGNGVYYEGFKIYNGSTPTWVGNTIIHAGNIGSQSVNYASYSGYTTGYSTSVELSSGNYIWFNGSGNHNVRMSESYGIVMNMISHPWHVQVLNGSFLVGLSASGGNYGTGNGYFTGDVTAYYSDRRLKHNLNRIGNALNKVMSLTGYTYQHNELGQELLSENPHKIHAGYVAQEVQAVLPEVVTIAPFDLYGYDEKGIGISKSGENYLTIKYERILPLVTEAIKEQQYQINDHDVIIKSQAEEIKELKRIINEFTN